MKTLISISFLSLVLLFSCNSTVDSQTNSDITFEKLNVPDFNKKLVELKNAQLIDVRTAGEVAEGAIPRAVNIDYYGDQFEKKMAALDANRPVLVYCKSGGRSGKTAKTLKKLGFKEIYDLAGGYTAWSANTK